MTDVLLLHDPEGDRNPYDSAPWSRDPLKPTNDETFEVGVQASRDVDSVALEWRSPQWNGSMSLESKNDVWSGRLGPFADDCHYRFVATHGLGKRTATEWFSVSITCWERVTFTDLSSGDEHIHICGDGARLTLQPGDGDTIRWTIDAESRHRGESTLAEVSGWEARIETGSLVVSRAEDKLVLSVEKAECDGQLRAWRLSWHLDADERIFGTGERFDSLDQRGKTPDIRVYEEYKQQGARTYFPVPWILSSNGYGLAVDGTARVRFDLGATDSDQASATIPTTTGATGTWYFGSPKEIIQAYTTDVGLPSAMPIWAYGPWMSGNEWDNDERIREVVNRTLTEGIPATVIVIEAWSDESTFYLFNDTEHDAVPGADPVPVEAMRHGGRWPDPKQLVEWLHKQGIRVLLWQIPVLKDMLKDTDEQAQHRADVTHADDAGLCVRTTEGGTYRNRGWWFPNSRIIDFSNPDARKWWFTKRAYLLDDIGIDGFKTDGGEHLWGGDVSAHDGSTGDEAANNYPTHYLSSYHEFMRDRGHENPMTFSRAGFTGSQSFPAHWAGDEDSTWEAYRASLTAGLTAGMAGIAFWGWDLAGFSKDLPSAELYKRCTAMAAFSPIMQYHSEHNGRRLPLADRTPWNVAEHTDDADVISVYRFYAGLRMNLIPYLMSLGAEATRTGLPLMRAMALEYPNDPRAAAIDDQFLLGSEVLVAPVLTPGAVERDIYLPEGDWWDLWSGERTETGWITSPTPQDRIPAYARGGACIPLWMPDTIELGAAVDLPDTGSGRPVLMVFPGSARHTVVDPITMQQWTVDVDLDGTILTLTTIDAPQGLTAWLRGSATPDRRADLHVPLPAGDSITTIDLAGHGR